MDRVILDALYERVSLGQFLACDGAKPAIGAVGELERVDEDKVEVVVRDAGESVEIREAISTLKEVCSEVNSFLSELNLYVLDAYAQVHPYEEVAYEVYKMEPF